MKQFTFVLIILFASLLTYYGQLKPETKLVDEIGQTNSESLAARFDGFVNQLDQNPNASGYVVIHNGKISDNRERFRYEQILKGFIRGRNYNNRRIYIIRAEDKNEVQIQFWLVPEGAEKPVFQEVKWNATIPLNKKSYLFTTTEWSERRLDTPAEYLNLNLFSEYLEANPNTFGYFVIREKSESGFEKEKLNIRKLLVNKYKVNSNHLKFRYKRESKSIADYYPDVEAWLIH